MKQLSKKFKILILALILVLISTIYIIIVGNTYTIKISNINGLLYFEKLEIKIDDDSIIEYIDKSNADGVIKVKVKSKEEGKTCITISDGRDNLNQTISNNKMFNLYVHKFGIITFNEYMGDFNGSIIIPISITLFLIYALYLLILSYKTSVKANMYQYKNIVYIGLIIFMKFAIISQILAVFRYKGIIDTIDSILSMFSISIMLFPIVFIVSILGIISNISLIRKEGFNLRNVLGIILGLFLCISTFLPELLYNLLYSATWIDIHNQNGIGLYIYNFFESIIQIFITYIECVLFGTIIMGIKSARNKPEFDKDFIVILGCQIKKDGTLTTLLKGRVDRAIEFSKMQKDKTGKEIIFVSSGGQGADEVISEAQAMKNYLLEQGIKEENILMEDKSKNTLENIKFSNKLIKEKMKNAKVAFSTTNYHVFRAGNIATEQNIYMEGIGSRTKQYFWINAFVREFIATLYSEKKKHFVAVGIMTFLTVIMTVITYLNNNM